MEKCYRKHHLKDSQNGQISLKTEHWFNLITELWLM